MAHNLMQKCMGLCAFAFCVVTKTVTALQTIRIDSLLKRICISDANFLKLAQKLRLSEQKGK